MKGNLKRNLYLITILVLITLIDLVLILNANKKRYSVVFIDGDEIYTFVVKAQDKVPERKGENENFIGWYSGDSLYDFNQKVNDDIVLKAKYEEIIMHRITFDTDGGSEVTPVMVKDSKTLIEVPKPTKENYVFDHWEKDNQVYDFNLPVISDFVLKAVWRELADNEKVWW